MTKYIFSTLLLFLSILCYAQNVEKTYTYFKFNEYLLDENSKTKIDSFFQNKKIKHILLKGHCDSIGNHAYNDNLSKKRVLEVKQYLISKNIRDSVIEIVALGKRVPFNNNENENARALNRCVEIEVMFSDFDSLIVINKQDTVKSKIIPKKTIDLDVKEIEFSGTTLNEKKRPIATEISLNDKDGNEIYNTISGKDGKYKFKATLKKNEDYSLIYYEDESFIVAKTVNVKNSKMGYKNITTIMPQLKGGKKYILGNMNFVADTSQLIPASLPSLFALYKLMKKNKSLVIQIEGHINGAHYKNYNKEDIIVRYHPPDLSPEDYAQWLSNERAVVVWQYLLHKGIDRNRISTYGWGAKKMLFPDAVNEEQCLQNRRVEIKVISFK
jgi:outer membrane protein OmpA-like peptidoglycan-associated protein